MSITGRTAASPVISFRRGFNVDALKNSFKAALQQNETQIGLWLALASPYSAEIVPKVSPVDIISV